MARSYNRVITPFQEEKQYCERRIIELAYNSRKLTIKLTSTLLDVALWAVHGSFNELNKIMNIRGSTNKFRKLKSVKSGTCILYFCFEIFQTDSE